MESVEDVGCEVDERVLVRDLLLQLKVWLLVTDFRMLSWRSMKVRIVGPQAQTMQTVNSSWLCEG